MFDKGGKTRPPHRLGGAHRRGALYSEHRAPRAYARFATRVWPSRYVGVKVRPAPPAKFALSPGTPLLLPASFHSLRHSFVTHLLVHGYGICTVRELLGHWDVSTTMVYTHVLNRAGKGVRSPADPLTKELSPSQLSWFYTDRHITRTVRGGHR